MRMENINWNAVNWGTKKYDGMYGMKPGETLDYSNNCKMLKATYEQLIDWLKSGIKRYTFKEEDNTITRLLMPDCGVYDVVVTFRHSDKCIGWRFLESYIYEV
jgi:hypothetical protein